MLVFISDLHLTDGTTGRFGEAGEVLGEFADHMGRLAGRGGGSRSGGAFDGCEIVLLGDFFDVARSTEWCGADGPKLYGEPSPEQEAATLKVLDGAVLNNANVVEWFARFSGGGGKLTYVPGNHDRLLQLYPGVRSKVRDVLGMPKDDGPFEIRIRRDSYGVVANHGHFTDPYSFEVADSRHPNLERDFLVPSISDALLSEIMCRLPGEVGGLIGGEEGRRIEMALHEIETIRPLTKVPQWIQSYVRRVKYADIVSECWERLANGFFNVPFVRQWMKRHDSCLNPVDDADRLEYALKLPAYLSLDWLSSIGRMSLITKLAETVTDADEALREARAEFRRPGNDAVRHVVLGHTHRPALMPVELDDGGARFYMNVGTWRKVQEEVAFPSKGREFTSYRILTYAVFDEGPAEGGGVTFQLWSCAAGGR